MAASLSRPDPTSPASVAEAGFSTARRGYSPDEVRAFLMSVSAEMRRLQERERQLEAELRAARSAKPGRAELDDETVAALLGEETLRVLQTARESAAQIKTRAEEGAARALREAHDEANRLRQDAEVDAARRRQDAQSEAEAEVAVAKQQGREMVNEARAYRERVLADLERRTKLARQHIEELAHGRERLLQVFERARLVAVDVTSELQTIAEPDEYVNFSPTTGPVPLMVPGSPRPPSRDDAVRSAEVDVDAPGDATAALPADLGGTRPFDAAADDLVVDGSTPEPDMTVADEVGDEAADEVDEPTIDEPEAKIGDEVVPAEDEARPAVRDTNVVALFPRAAEPPTDTRPAVDDLFARLRGETTDHTDADPGVEADTDSDDPVEPVAEADTAHDHDGAVPVAASPFSRRDEALVPLIVTGARKLKRVLADEQNGVLDTLRRREPVRDLDAVLPTFDEHVALYAEALVDELVTAAAAGACEVGATDTPSLRRTLVKAGALDAARSLVSSDLVGALRDRLERAVVEGSGDNDDVARRIRSVYRAWKTQHIDDHLDDVFRYAYGSGLAVSVPPGTPMRWTIDPSEPACADCEDNSLAGPMPAGEEYPTGHTMAPAHPGCRCLTLPTGQ